MSYDSIKLEKGMYAVSGKSFSQVLEELDKTFDEVNLDYMDQGYVFGKVNDTYVMLAAKSSEQATFRFKNDYASASDIETDISKIKTNVANMIKESGDLRYDLILEGGHNHAWITEVSSVEEDGTFTSFINRYLKYD